MLLFAAQVPGDVRLHAVGRARIGPADRRLGARRVSRAARGHPRADDGAVERAAAANGTTRCWRPPAPAAGPQCPTIGSPSMSAARGGALMDPARYRSAVHGRAARRRRAHAALRRALPALVDRHFYLKEGEVELLPLSLPQLYTAGVECGHTAARGELKHQIGTSAQLGSCASTSAPCRTARKGDREAARRELSTQRVDRADPAQRRRMRQRRCTPAQVEHARISSHRGARGASTSSRSSRAWRMTAPLRRAGHRAKVAARTLRALAGAGCGACRSMSVMAMVDRCATKGRARSRSACARRCAPEERFKPAPSARSDVEDAIDAARVRAEPRRRACRSSSRCTASRC